MIDKTGKTVQKMKGS